MDTGGPRGREDGGRTANVERDGLRTALGNALGDEFIALVDSHPGLLEQHPDHLWALVELDDPVERMRLARAYVAQLEGLRSRSQLRGILSPAEAHAAQRARPPAPTPPAGEEPGARAPRVSAGERASAQLRLRVEGWLSEVEQILRKIDASTLDRLQAEDRQVVEDRIDRVRSRLLFLVSGRRYPD